MSPRNARWERQLTTQICPSLAPRMVSGTSFRWLDSLSWKGPWSALSQMGLNCTLQKQRILKHYSSNIHCEPTTCQVLVLGCLRGKEEQWDKLALSLSLLNNAPCLILELLLRFFLMFKCLLKARSILRLPLDKQQNQKWWSDLPEFQPPLLGVMCGALSTCNPMWHTAPGLKSWILWWGKLNRSLHWHFPRLKCFNFLSFFNTHYLASIVLGQILMVDWTLSL